MLSVQNPLWTSLEEGEGKEETGGEFRSVNSPLGGPAFHPIRSEEPEASSSSALRPSSTSSSLKKRSLTLEVFRDSSVLIVAWVTFVGDASRGVLFPVMWTLCQALNGTVVDMGYLVAMFSLGRLVVTAPLGYFCDIYRHKLSLILANITLLIGALLWANAFASHKLPILYLAQFIMGCGSGSLGVTRSFLVEQVEPKHRTSAMSIITAIQYAGFTVSPFIGSLFTLLHGKSNLYWKFALPGYLIGLMSGVTLYALFNYFQDLKTVKPPTPSPLPPSASTSSLTDAAPLIPVTSEEAKSLALGAKTIIIVMLVLNITTKGSIAVYETLCGEIGMADYGLSSLELGALISLSGIGGFINLLLFESFWTFYFTDLQLMLGGILVMTIPQFLLINYDHLPSRAAYISAVVIMYSMGYPIGHTAVLGGFSKIQKSGPQAALMGWFATAGSLARIVLPIISGYLDMLVDNGPFSIVLAMLAASYIGIVLLEKKIRFYIEPASASSIPQSERDRHTPLTLEQKTQLFVMAGIFVFAFVSLSFSSEHHSALNIWESEGYTDAGP